jgi:exonuclease I
MQKYFRDDRILHVLFRYRTTNYRDFVFLLLGATYDISNKHRLGYSEVQLVQTMIDGVNALYKEDLELQKKHGL